MSLTQAIEYYFKHEGQLEGPLSSDEIQFLAGRGRLSADDLVRLGKNGEWQKAGTIEGLFQQQLSSLKDGLDTSSSDTTNALRAQWRPGAESVPGGERIANVASHPVSNPQIDSLHSNKRRNLLIAAAIALIAILILLFILWLFPSGEAATSAGSGSGVKNENSGGHSKKKEKEKSSDKASTQSNKKADPQQKKDSKSKDKPKLSKKNPQPVKKTDPEKKNPKQNPTQKKDVNPFIKNDPSEYSIGGGEFFGTRARGSKFVYVVDCSGSMQGGRLEKVKHEIRRSIHALVPDQKFHVIFFSDRAFPMFYPKKSSKLRPATKSNLDRVNKWVKNFNETGGTDPREAIKLALKMKPDAIFLLTDGEFESGVLDTIRKNNTKKVSIYTFGFQHSFGERILRQIASENNGEFRYVQ